MSKRQELMARYGELCVQQELLAGELQRTKTEIAAILNEEAQQKQAAVVEPAEPKPEGEA